MMRMAPVSVMIGLTILAVAVNAPAQPDCKSYYGYWNGNSVTCTNDPGINCVVCPKPQ